MSRKNKSAAVVAAIGVLLLAIGCLCSDLVMFIGMCLLYLSTFLR